MTKNIYVKNLQLKTNYMLQTERLHSWGKEKPEI